MPTLEQLERALHIRGAIEALQSELSTLLGELADALAPNPNNAPDEVGPKGPFADSLDGARAQRIARHNEDARRAKKARASTARRKKSRSKTRLWSLLSGGEIGILPVATEQKKHGPKAKKSSRAKRTRKAPVAKRPKRARR